MGRLFLSRYQEILPILFIKKEKKQTGLIFLVSANIYFPALNNLASDLRVSDSLINLTITSYMVRGKQSWQSIQSTSTAY